MMLAACSLPLGFALIEIPGKSHVSGDSFLLLSLPSYSENSPFIHRKGLALFSNVVMHLIVLLSSQDT